MKCERFNFKWCNSCLVKPYLRPSMQNHSIQEKHFIKSVFFSSKTHFIDPLVKQSHIFRKTMFNCNRSTLSRRRFQTLKKTTTTILFHGMKLLDFQPSEMYRQKQLAVMNFNSITANYYRANSSYKHNHKTHIYKSSLSVCLAMNAIKWKFCRDFTCATHAFSKPTALLWLSIIHQDICG